MKCTKCSATLIPDAAYCHACGKKQAQDERKHRKRTNGAGNITKLTGNRKRPWRARKDGVLIGYYETRGAAEAALSALTGREVSDRYNMTFAEVYEDWRQEHYREVTDVTRELYEDAFKQFSELHDKPFRNLRTTDFQRCLDFYAYKKNNGRRERSRSTCSKLKNLIGQMSKYAVREEVTSSNFAPFIKLPDDKSKSKVKELFTISDIEKLESTHDDAAKITLMLIYTGMRVGELFSMRCEDVFDKYCIGGVKTEAGKNRIIPIPANVRRHFEYFKEISGNKGLLLSGYVGSHGINNFRKRDYYPMLDQLKIKRKTIHTTRHTFASMAANSGMRQEHLQKILGHASYTTSADVYVHADMETLIKAVESITSRK